ncbi:Circadian clock protein kinase KaiC [Fervidicola ferrireducens]|uniref:Circadian clock protein kinase KaiC n=1 Tax=Fervidicola ferrireducens TaxID=520764 RepID=A0A140L9N2_9FIRM|nr:ATPase domain-containing protein [Fervidicola ferrireducens]KXG77257.1 Circadian clock protein kinase KaiC [Fervidicola ferrireducens]
MKFITSYVEILSRLIGSENAEKIMKILREEMKDVCFNSNILGGGIPLYSLNIVSGAPGSGKIIFVQNIIFNSARDGLRSLYLTTVSESQFKMVRHLQEFDFFSDEFLGDKFIYGDLGAFVRKQGPDKILGYLTDMVKKHKPNIVVIDSFKAIRDLFPDEKTFKAFVYDLAATLSIWEVTVFLVGEYEEKELTVLSEFAVADGIFHLYGQEEKRFQKRYLRILKMRGTSFEQGEHLFEITPAGIKVYPRIKPAGKELQYEVKTEKKDLESKVWTKC